MPPRYAPITKTAPAPVVGRAIPTLDPRTLSPVQRQKLWASIKRINPALAEILTTDQNIKALKEQFGAFIIFEEAEANQYLQD